MVFTYSLGFAKRGKKVIKSGAGFGKTLRRYEK